MRRLLFVFSLVLGLVAVPALAANPQVELETTADPRFGLHAAQASIARTPSGELSR